MKPLFSEFSATNFDQWKARLLQDLKVDSVDKYLSTRIEELETPVYLEQENAPQAHPISGMRIAHHPEFAFANDWEICVDVDTADLVQANKQGLKALESGATAVRFTGHEISNQEELILTLRNILPEIARIHFDCGEASASLLFLYQDEIARRKLDPLRIQGSVSLDPLGDFAFTGAFPYSREESIQLVQVARDFAALNMPLFKTISVDASRWYNSGASAVQELAFSLSTLNEYFIELGEDKDKTARSMQLRMASGSEYFQQIAKFRSIRLLWAMLLEGHNLDANDLPLWLCTETAQRTKTLYDPYNNLLRATTESMAAILGGTDEHVVHPHDSLFRKSDDASRRHALNIQHLLHDESSLDKVSDPAAGSYLIEQLTLELTQKAWALFLQLEAKGGFVASLRSGYIQDQVLTARVGLENSIRTRKRSIVGVSSFAAPQAKVKMEIQQQRDPLAKLPEIRVVEPFREAAMFESFRQAFTLDGNPTAFLAVFGDPSKRSARAGFAREFLSIAGFISSTGDAQVALLDQMHADSAKQASVLVLCAADEDYLASVELLLQNGWPEVPILIAGNPSNKKQLSELGIHDFIYIGCDAAAVFGRLSEEVLL